MPTVRAMACIFKTDRDAEWRSGIAVGPDIGDVNTITDMNGKVVEPIWDYRTYPANGCFTLTASAYVSAIEVKSE